MDHNNLFCSILQSFQGICVLVFLTELRSLLLDLFGIFVMRDISVLPVPRASARMGMHETFRL